MAKTRSIALSGILAAINLIILYIASVLPTSRFFLLALSSFVVATIVIESNMGTGFIFYIVTSVLTVLLLPNKFIAAFYILLFGCYGLIKSFIEQKSKTKYIEIILKFLFFNIDLFITYNIFSNFFMLRFYVTKYPIIVFLLTLQFLFLFYDYVFTIFISYYYKHVKRKVK